MLRIERADYRRSKEADLLAGLHAHDPLALAEAYHRTSPAAHACARRLLGGTREVEALLHAVYGELWSAPPEIARLEGWVRSRCFRLGSEHLRARDEPPAAASLILLLPDLPAPAGSSHDPAEQALAALTDSERRALLLAHDQGMPTAAQGDPDAAAVLDRVLMALAGPGEGVDDGTGEQCDDVPEMADWALGLLASDRAAQVTAQVVDRPACASRSRALRRGRRRLEGLPAAPDLGQRVLAAVLGSSLAPPPAPGRIGADTPRPAPAPPASSLGDAPVRPPPIHALPSALDEEPPAAPPDPAGATPPAAAPTEPGDAEAHDVSNTAAADAAEHDPVLDVTATDTVEHIDRPDDHDVHDVHDVHEHADGDLHDDEHADGEQRNDDQRADADSDGTVGDHVGDLATTEREPDDQPGEAADEVAKPVAVADSAPESAADDATDDAPDDTADADTGRGVGRKLLNVLVVILVLAAGAGLGLLIGILLVGGR